MAGHKKENAIVLSACIVTILLLLKYIPRNKLREALVPFLFQQAITWFCGLLVVEKKWIKYPYRMYFKTSSKSSFIFEYFFFPAFTSLYNSCYPDKKSFLFKAFYTFSYSGVVTFFEVFIEKYTSLISYKKWNWYWSFLSMSMAYCLSRLYYWWFFKLEE